MSPIEPMWRPGAGRVERARITAFTKWLARERGLAFANYESMWLWSVTDLEGFWSAIWQFFDIRASAPYERVLAARGMPGAEWFPGARLNLADQVFRHASGSRPAIVAGNESGAQQELSWRELERQVGALAASLRALGVVPGDRVVAILPNIPQAIIAFLACASVGAVWSVCSPDMGPVAVLDRFRQIAPKVLIAADGYRYGGKAYERGAMLAKVRAALPSLEHTVVVPNLDGVHDPVRVPGALPWAELVSGDAPLVTTQVASAHPLWVVYSSGTTGLPKAIVHGHAGALVEMLKGVGLHRDIGPGDRFHWYTSTGWIMWNVQVSGLVAGATAVLYDGNPGFPDLGVLWRFVSAVGATFFGAGAAFYANCMKAGIEPAMTADLSTLQTLGSTGSPLPPEAYRWAYGHVKRDLWLVSIAGGTDLAGAFLTGLPTLPVYEGEMQCRALGLKVEAYDDAGRPVIGEVGELVCTEPFPSMPLCFWNDPGDARYRESYFETYPGAWRHGDWVKLVARPEAVGGIIYGRSDATINRHGIRMGTAELYRAVEGIPEVIDSLVVDLEYLGRESYMPLFVVLRPGVVLDDALKARLNDTIRAALSARHVPSEILAVAEVPRTLSAKKMELPVKKLLLGHPLEKVAHADAMANPSSLDWFVEFARRRAAQVDSGR
ncbi:MAG TPA: acetoacetate--CoA ligase [Burkholderiaceae bacterium]|nr:acetoacetate--CoA ligase [Burkholderiaceae bacterium]HQR71339.1 acetoacetate--CoA ligase [Burkholderiaceae bacterium]